MANRYDVVVARIRGQREGLDLALRFMDDLSYLFLENETRHEAAFAMALAVANTADGLRKYRRHLGV